MQDALAMLTELSIPRRLFKSSVNAPEPASHVSGLHGAGVCHQASSKGHLWEL